MSRLSPEHHQQAIVVGPFQNMGPKKAAANVRGHIIDAYDTKDIGLLEKRHKHHVQRCLCLFILR